MCTPTFLRTLGLSLALLLPTAAGAAKAAPEQAFVDRVAQKLLTVSPAPEGVKWPPVFVVTELPASGRINACARLEHGEKRDEQPRPRVEVSHGMLADVVQGDADRLAYILGHELGHVLLGHIRPRAGETSPFVEAAMGRERELAADRKGMELAGAAGFAAAGAVKAIERAIVVEGDYSPFEGLLSDHPCWGDRLAALDPSRPRPAAGHRDFRGLASLTLPDGKVVHVGDAAAEVERQLGAPSASEMVRGTGLRRMGYAAHEVEFLVGDRVLAIHARSLGALPLALRGTDPTGAAALRTGMERDDLDRLLGDTYEYVQILDPEVNYRYYRNLGLAVRLQAGRVAELVIVQVPARRLAGG
jgi:hypothetical protein